MPAVNKEAATDPKKLDPLLKAHLEQDLGIPLAAIFERGEGTMAGEDAIRFVLEAERLLRLGRAHGDILQSGYVYGTAHYFINSNDPAPNVGTDKQGEAGRPVAAELPGPPLAPKILEPHPAPSEPRAQVLLAAMVSADPRSLGHPSENGLVPADDTAAPRRAAVAAPTRVVFQGTVVESPAATPPARSAPRKPAPAVNCTFQRVETHVVGERQKRLSIEGLAEEDVTAGKRLVYDGGVSDSLRLIDASLFAQQELPLDSTLEVGGQPDNCDDPP